MSNTDQAEVTGTRFKKTVIKVLMLVVLLIVVARVVSAFSKPGIEPGVRNGRLAECPASPNCVSSQAPQDSQAWIEPLHLPQSIGDDSEAWNRLLALVGDMSGSRLISQSDGYTHFEFRSLVFGFVDDLELLLDSTNHQVHVRSASRLGYSDMGANRKRVERIREQWTTSDSATN